MESVDQVSIETTEKLIRPYLRTTPLAKPSGADFGLNDIELTLKLEFIQHAGSFKTRGAFANLLTREIPDAGVVAASGGNHGAAVAFAAARRGVAAKIFVPDIASPAKIEQIRSYGAELVVGGERYADALAASERWVEHSGALPIHAYDQCETLVGQGSVGLELERQMPEIDSLLVSVGGGGLIGGIAGWYQDRIKLIGVEPDSAPTLRYALDAGRPVDAPAGGIAADSLAPRRIGELPFALAERFVDDVVLVDDDAIRNAQKLLWQRLRIVTEPGGAAAFAALSSGRYRAAPGERVGVLLCGANTTAVNFAVCGT